MSVSSEKVEWDSVPLKIQKQFTDLARVIHQFTGESIASILRRTIIAGFPKITGEAESLRVGLISAAKTTMELENVMQLETGDERRNRLRKSCKKRKTRKRRA